MQVFFFDLQKEVDATFQYLLSSWLLFCKDSLQERVFLNRMHCISKVKKEMSFPTLISEENLEMIVFSGMSFMTKTVSSSIVLEYCRVLFITVKSWNL